MPKKPKRNNCKKNKPIEQTPFSWADKCETTDKEDDEEDNLDNKEHIEDVEEEQEEDNMDKAGYIEDEEKGQRCQRSWNYNGKEDRK